tara:strand:- start:21 stop:611 length:591 start_codon:yes stop_codon:yes gene_type:complete
MSDEPRFSTTDIGNIDPTRLTRKEAVDEMIKRFLSQKDGKTKIEFDSITIKIANYEHAKLASIDPFHHPEDNKQRMLNGGVITCHKDRVMAFVEMMPHHPLISEIIASAWKKQLLSSTLKIGLAVKDIDTESYLMLPRVDLTKAIKDGKTFVPGKTEMSVAYQDSAKMQKPVFKKEKVNTKVVISIPGATSVGKEK